MGKKFIVRVQNQFIVCLCLSLFFVSRPADVLAESNPASANSIKKIQLDPIIVTARRVFSESDSIAEDVVIYTADDLHKIGARDLGQALQHIPGVDVSVRTQFGQATSVSIQGSASRQVLVMVDGVPFNTQLSGQANPTRIPVEHIKQIEVIKGASSSVWGSSLGGVINVITKNTGETEIPQGTFTTSFAEYRTFKNSLSLSGKIGQLGYFVSGSYLDTDGPMSHTDVEELKTYAKVSYPLGDLAEVIASFGYSGADVRFGVNPNNRIIGQPYISRYGQMTFQSEDEYVRFRMSFKYNDQDVITDIYNASTGANVSSTVSRNLYKGLSLSSEFDLFDDDLLVVGADFEWQRLKSNNFLSESKSVHAQAPYINYRLRWGRWDFIPGVRYDHNQQFGEQTSPSIGIVHRFNDRRNTRIRLKASRGFNAPPLLWIYNNDPGLFVGPNPDLKPERSDSYQIGVTSELTENLDLEFNVFRADIRDAIDLIFDSTNFVFVQQNFEKFRRQGAELLVDYSISPELSVYASGAFTDVENRVTGKTVRSSSAARQRYTFGIRYLNRRHLGVYLSGYYKRWSSSASSQPNDRKPIFDLKLTKEFKEIKDKVDLEAFLIIHNLTNSKYWSVVDFPLPRRYFEGGISLSF